MPGSANAWKSGIVLGALTACAACSSAEDATPSDADTSSPAADAGGASSARDGGSGRGDAGGGGRDGASADSGACTDTCAFASGVEWECKKRFVYGANWAWQNWGADFGGISAWSKKGVAGDPGTFDSAMKQMKASGGNVIRWWMFPRFLTESIQFGADDTPSGIGGTLTADIQKALDLAAQNDMYIMLTPFSFDNFKATANESGITSRSMKPMITDATRRKELIDNLVVPIARAVEASPNKGRMIAWDMINEPEWAITGTDSYGDEAFGATVSDPVTFAQMETFLQEMEAALHKNSTALVSIGGAAIKWGRAWTHVNVDFYMLHYYDWVYQYYPYKTVTPASIGLTKPVVLGEFPSQGLSAVGGNPARTTAEYTADLYAAGYAGALPWAYNDTSDAKFAWTPSGLQSLSTAHACETKY